MPCTRAVKTALFTVYGRVRAAYTAVIGSRTDHVRGPCTAVCTVCTRPWAAVYTGRKQGRTRAMHMVRPCPEHGRVRSRYVAKHGRVRGRVRTVYVAVHGPCTVYTAVYTAVFTARVHGRVRTMYTAVHGLSMIRARPCTRSCTMYTAVFTARVQYTARKRPCTADGHGRVYGPCTWPCTVYMHVFVACV